VAGRGHRRHRRFPLPEDGGSDRLRQQVASLAETLELRVAIRREFETTEETARG
jgi:hypothetical protein